MMIFAAPEQAMGVGVAARADDVVDAATVRVTPYQPSVSSVIVASGRRYGSVLHSRSPVADMGGVERARLAAEEALGEIVRVPRLRSPTCGPSI